MFPINIINSRALFDLSMGYIERKNYKNTSWEKAKTEVPTHKWVNLNNKDMSVSLLNNNKHGHEINQNVINLTLLKSGIFPDPKADLGTHEFSYSLLLNPNPIDIINIEKESLMLNNKAIYHQNNKKAKNSTVNKIFDIENDHVSLDSFKIAENEESYILRVHEFAKISKKLKIYFYKELKKVYETNLIEKNINEIPIKNNSICIKINPFEIKTFRIKFI